MPLGHLPKKKCQQNLPKATSTVLLQFLSSIAHPVIMDEKKKVKGHQTAPHPPICQLPFFLNAFYQWGSPTLGTVRNSMQMRDSWKLVGKPIQDILPRKVVSLLFCFVLNWPRMFKPVQKLYLIFWGKIFFKSKRLFFGGGGY